MENGSSRVKFSRGRSVIVETKLTHGFKLANMQLVQIVSGDLH
jgi:hypothetical protein